MAPIEWAYVASLGGDLIEDFAATCLRQRYPDAVQTKPASGDGGIDIYRRTAEGLVVWQIKKFATRLDKSQKQQVKKSWKRFWDNHVAEGEKIAEYYLATPWTPTDSFRQWFDGLTEAATFPTQWDGASFFNGLSAEFPATADRFFKGPDMLENMVLAKAALAQLPAETGNKTSLVEALRVRDEALRNIRDLVSDNYYIDAGERSSRVEGQLPLPGPDEAGVQFRYTALDDRRYYVESVVPRNVQSTQLEPITMNVTFHVKAGSDDARRLEEWRVWGVPFHDIDATTQQRGGPLAEPEPRRSLLSVQPPPLPPNCPNLEFSVESPSEPTVPLTVVPKEITRGVAGGGFRILTSSRSGLIEAELRVRSKLASDSLSIGFLPATGLSPAAVRDDLRGLIGIGPADTYVISVSGPGLPLAKGTGLNGHVVQIALQIAVDLVDLELHTTSTFSMPDVDEVTPMQAEHLHRLANIYRGEPEESTWERLSLVITGDPASLVRNLSSEGHLVISGEPTFNLGRTAYHITRPLVTVYSAPRIAPSTDIEGLQPGDEIELTPAGDNRVTISTPIDAVP